MTESLDNNPHQQPPFEPIDLETAIDRGLLGPAIESVDRAAEAITGGLNKMFLRLGPPPAELLPPPDQPQ